jgi:hypothetical protein
MGPSFLDPQTSKDGKPYGPARFKEIVKECWFISDQISTSYTDVLDMSVQERIYLGECIQEKLDATHKAIEDIKNKNKAKK